MIQIKDHAERGSRILLFFGQKACTRRRLSLYREGEQRLEILAKELMLAHSLQLAVSRREGVYFIGDEEISDEHPFYFYTAQKEKILLILTKELREISGAGRLVLSREEACVIGSAYQNRIFYDYCSLVSPRHVRIGYEGEEVRIYSAQNEGVYVNEQLLAEEKGLKTGDRVDIYGFHILVLKGFLLCSCFSGISRLSGGGIDLKLFYNDFARDRRKIPENAPAAPQNCLIERKWEKEQQLHDDQVEILVPALRTRENPGPLALSLGPSVTMVIPMLVMAWLGTSLGQGSSFYLLSVAMGICSAALALFWGMVNYGYRRHEGGKSEKQRALEYREYLQGMKDYLNACMEDNRRILQQKYPPADTFLESENQTPKVLWNRYFRQEDFLFLRLGTGETEFQMKVVLAQKSNKIVPDLLFQEGEKLVKDFQRIKQVPVGVDFLKVRQLGIVADPEREDSYEILYQLLVQLAACQCYTEMKVVCFFDRGKPLQKRLADGLSWMPHSWSPDGKTRYLAGDERESAQILPTLMSELERGRDKQGDSAPWHLVLVLNDKLVLGELLYQYLTDSESSCRISAVFMRETRAQLPKSCRSYLDCICEKEMVVCLEDRLYRQSMDIERLAGKQAESYFRSISGFRVVQTGMEEQIPEKMDFLTLYDCCRAEDLNIVRRWRDNQPGERMKVPIGCGVGGNIVCLDIHEKFHGPHGLIAGTTGSGKSELLLTFLLSMMVSFSPEDVNFFMIDYKGGGTGNALQHLPHCAGIISNLSGKQIKRAMSAITSENRRRQELLSSYGVNHIDAYTRLYRENKADKPLPHLILVVDEFAQLKKEEPEFMQEIISLSQVGRSLGIHLILATQKPAGTVDDRIWSNARFHLCLKVQDRQDSMDMLHNGDAALLTAPGQCYLQIGGNEYYALFQTGYCGGSYAPKEDQGGSTALVEGTGRRRYLPKESIQRQSQLEVIADQIKQAAKREQSIFAKALWMPELPDRVLLKELKRTKIPAELQASKESEFLLGQCDDPENQSQFPLGYDPVRTGHMAVCGGPLSGKSNLLKLVLQQILIMYTPDQARVLGVDMSQKSMDDFVDLPGMLGVLQEKENKDIFFYHLERLFKERKNAQIVFLIIDNIASLLKELEERQLELLLRLAAEGMGCGIYLILSASSASEIPGRIYEKIKMTLALEMSDRFAYGDILRQYSLPVLPKENTKGRGLCRVDGRVLEFQSAVCLDREEFFRQLKSGTEARGEISGELAVFPRIPQRPMYEIMKREYKWKENHIPLGYSLSTGVIKDLDLERHCCFLLSDGGGRRKGKFLENMAESLLFLGKSVMWLDENHPVQELTERKKFACIGQEELGYYHQNPDPGACFFIPDIGWFVKRIGEFDAMRDERMAFWEGLAAGNEKSAFLAGGFDPFRDGYLITEEFFRLIAAWQVGIHLGGNGAAQRIFSFDDLGYARLNQSEAENTGYWKEGAASRTQRLLIPGMREKEL